MHIVFRYGDLFEVKPLYAQQPAAGPYPPMGERARMYSTGRLEAALATHDDLSVVCSIPALGGHDDWWASRIPEGRIFLAPDLSEIKRMGWEHDPVRIALAPWRNCCAALNIKLSEKHQTVEAVLKRLGNASAVILGDDIPPWSYGRHP